MVESAPWGDFVGSIVRARDGIIRELVAGTPNRYGERGDDEKRAMIHAFNMVLRVYSDVEHDANAARAALSEWQARETR